MIMAAPRQNNHAQFGMSDAEFSEALELGVQLTEAGHSDDPNVDALFDAAQEGILGETTLHHPSDDNHGYTGIYED
jgi:hypothetical protein